MRSFISKITFLNNFISNGNLGSSIIPALVGNTVSSVSLCMCGGDRRKKEKKFFIPMLADVCI